MTWVSEKHRVAVLEMDCGGSRSEWGVFAQGNYITSCAERSEAEQVARRVASELALEAGDA